MSAKDPLVHKERDEQKLADVQDPRDASVVQPWSPDPEARPGTPPVAGEGGERGSYAFPGTELFTSEGEKSDAGFIGDVVPDTHYPLHGVDYWEGSVPTGNHSNSNDRGQVEGSAERG